MKRIKWIGLLMVFILILTLLPMTVMASNLEQEDISEPTSEISENQEETTQALPQERGTSETDKVEEDLPPTENPNKFIDKEVIEHKNEGNDLSFSTPVPSASEKNAPLSSFVAETKEEISLMTITDIYEVDGFRYQEIATGRVKILGFIDPDSAVGTLTIPESITVDVDGVQKIFSVTGIGNNAFAGLYDLTGSLIIPNSITNIGAYAFNGGYNFIGQLVIPEGVTNIGAYAFAGCGGFTGPLVIPNNVQNINVNAFAYCAGFDSVTIGNGVKNIGAYAFDGCSGLSSVTLGNNVTNIGAYAFNDCSNITGTLIFPNSVRNIDLGAFKQCSSITGTLIIPEGTTNLGVNAFIGCTQITAVVVPDSINVIGGDIFAGCTGLGNASITATSQKVYTLLINANVPSAKISFSGGMAPVDHTENGLRYLLYEESGTKYAILIGRTVNPAGAVIIPEKVNGDYTVTGIGDAAFYYNYGMTEITIPNTVTSIGDKAFSGCSDLTGILDIPDGVTSIGDNAFSWCTSLTAISLPDSVTNIGNDAFSWCSGLTDNLDIPDGVETIGNSAFSWCSGLISVHIPNSVTSIGADAFADCSALETIFIGNGLDNISFSAFDRPSSAFAISTNSPRVQLLLVQNLSLEQGNYPYCSWEANENVPGGAIAHVDKDQTTTSDYLIEDGATVTVDAGKTLTVDNLLTLEGELTIDGTLAGSSSIHVGTTGNIRGNIDGLKITYANTYPIIGKNSFILDDNSIVFTVDGSFSKYLQSRLNEGITGISATAQSGSTVITLSTEWLSSLPSGDNTVYALFEDGIASITVTEDVPSPSPSPTSTVRPSPTSPSTAAVTNTQSSEAAGTTVKNNSEPPNTGDNNDLTFWLLLCAIAGAGITIVIIGKLKKVQR